MGTLQEQLASVQARLNSERELGGQKDADKIATLEAQEADLTRQIMEQAQQDRATEQEQKIAEADSMELPFDLDADLDTMGVNKLIRQMIKDERTKNFADFNKEYERVNADADAKVNGALEREIQLQRQNGELQEHLKTAEKRAIDLQMTLDQVNSNHQDVVARFNDTNLRMAEVEQNRMNAMTLLEESNAENEHLRAQINMGERQSQYIIDVTPTINDLYEQAKQATAEKRKVIVTAELGLYREVQDADGSKEMVHHTALAGMEQVYSFPELPELPAAPFAKIEEADISSGLGNAAAGTDQGVQASEAVTLESLKAEVDAIKSHLGMVA